MLEHLPKIPTPTDILERLKVKPPLAKIIDPSILQTILLDEIAGRLEDLGELTQQFRDIATLIEKQMPRIPEGVTYPIELTIKGNVITEYAIEDEPDAGSRPWLSATIYSDGPDNCWVRANNVVGRFQKFTDGEAVDIDFKAPLLKKLYFKCGSATASTALRILGEA